MYFESMAEETTPQNIIQSWLTERLNDIQMGIGPDPDTTEILRIKAALDADRPTGDMVMTVIFNAFTFLHKDYPLQSDEEFQHIMAFLEAFHKATQTDFLNKVSTQKDGLAMQVTSTD